MSIFEQTQSSCNCNNADCYFCWLRNNAEQMKDFDYTHRILHDVARISGVSVEQIVGKSRRKEIVIARQMFCYLARQYGWLNDTQIGKTIGHDRVTVIHSSKVVETMIEVRNPDYIHSRVWSG